MSTALKSPPITVEQYEGFEGYPGLRDELIYGEIVLSPQPKPLHQQVAENVQFLLRSVLARQPYVAKQNSNIKFSGAHSMPAPDVFVVKRDEWVQACKTDSYLEAPPVLVVEILSPANRKRRVEQKVDLYLKEGVRCVWIVDPKRLRIFRHAVRKPEQELNELDTLALPEPLQGEIRASDIFLFE